MVVVMLMVMLVDLLLLYATAGLLGSRTSLWRFSAAAMVGGILAGLSLLKEFSILGSFWGQLCVIALTGVLALGFSKEGLKHLLLFALLRLSVGGVAGKERILPMLLGAAGIGFACFCLSRKSKFIPVELCYGGQTYRITALYDTGNTLRDPITGKSVMVVDADVARGLTGLDADALRDPVSSIARFPGLRLIPYQSVGNSGFLLALQIPEAKVGNRKENIIVALSPHLLSRHYQALTGGTL